MWRWWFERAWPYIGRRSTLVGMNKEGASSSSSSSSIQTREPGTRPLRSVLLVLTPPPATPATACPTRPRVGVDHPLYLAEGMDAHVRLELSGEKESDTWSERTRQQKPTVLSLPNANRGAVQIRTYRGLSTRFALPYVAISTTAARKEGRKGQESDPTTSLLRKS
jgi:hypothetical protein